MPVFLQYVHLSVHVFFEQIIFITSKTVLPSTTVTVVSLNIMPFWGRKAFFSGRSLSMLSRIVWQFISIVQVTVLFWDVVFGKTIPLRKKYISRRSRVWRLLRVSVTMKTNGHPINSRMRSAFSASSPAMEEAISRSIWILRRFGEKSVCTHRRR